MSAFRSDRIQTISQGYLELAPDLAVEVLSPSESTRKVEKKTAQWLSFGSLIVWLVYPRTRTVEVRRVSGQNRLLTQSDELSGDDVVPGFRIPVNEIFC